MDEGLALIGCKLQVVTKRRGYNEVTQNPLASIIYMGNIFSSDSPLFFIFLDFFFIKSNNLV